jgi:hypothetical protein
VQSRHLRGAPAAFAGDDFVLARLARRTFVYRAHDDGLHHALRLDGIRQFLQRLRTHVHARLVLAPLQQVDRQLGQLFIGPDGSDDGLDGRGLAQQCSQSAPEAWSFGHDGVFVKLT